MIFVCLLFIGKAKQFRHFSGWHWFVLSSDIVVLLSIIAAVWVKLDRENAKALCLLLGGIAYVFILREYGVIRPPYEKH